MLDFVMRCLEKNQKKRFDCKEAFMHPLIKNVDLGLIVKQQGLTLKKSLLKMKPDASKLKKVI